MEEDFELISKIRSDMGISSLDELQYQIQGVQPESEGSVRCESDSIFVVDEVDVDTLLHISWCRDVYKLCPEDAARPRTRIKSTDTNQVEQSIFSANKVACL